MMEKNVVARSALPRDRQHREKGEVPVQDALSRVFSTGFLLRDPIVCFHHLLTMPGNYRSISELLIGYASIFISRSYPQRPTSEHPTGNQAFGWLFIAEP